MSALFDHLQLSRTTALICPATRQVWWDEAVKYRVMFGRSIRGEVRVRDPKRTITPDPKIQRLREFAGSYDCDMHLYRNNCRTFCARVRREVRDSVLGFRVFL